MLAALVRAEARFLVVGAHALAVHGLPRATGDLDVWIASDATNAARVWSAIVHFGAPVAAMGVSLDDLTHPDTGRSDRRSPAPDRHPDLDQRGRVRRGVARPRDARGGAPLDTLPRPRGARAQQAGERSHEGQGGPRSPRRSRLTAPAIDCSGVSLEAGQTLARYRITAAIGAGGMGEVYRATRHDARSRRRHQGAACARWRRTPNAWRASSARRKLLASLNHPNIAHVYGFESATLPDGSTAHFLAMELVEGEDLADRLQRGADPRRRGARHREADRRGARGSPRARHRPPRPEARERQDHARRQGEGPRLRAREGLRGRRVDARRVPDSPTRRR